MSAVDRLLTGLAQSLPPETAHRAAIVSLRAAQRVARRMGTSAPRDGASLAVSVAGLDLPNPIGLAAGFDKDAEAPDACLALGFGFVECGTVTPRPQAGNPRPRVFRLAPERALINRLGFNSGGFQPAAARLARRLEAGAAHGGRHGVVGVNLGANKDSADRVADYVAGLERFWSLVDYVTINVSSPNTPGLRGLQEGAALSVLLARLGEAKARLTAHAPTRPLFLKVAPDLDGDAVVAIARTVQAQRAVVDGLIVSNTTLARPTGLAGPASEEAGGLSGRPLFVRSTRVLAQFRRALGPATPLIGAGGVDSGATAYAKIRAGASAVQLYTGLVYQGPFLARRIARELAALLAADGHSRLADAVGVDAVMWADARAARPPAQGPDRPPPK